MDLIYWIFLGILAALLAHLIKPGREPGGFVVTILLGIAGALLAGYVGISAGWYAPGEVAGLITATVGALVVLGVYRALRRNG